MIRTYTDLIAIPTFVERFEYLKLMGSVGADTFGCDRYLNQIFYTTREWRHLRGQVILRDMGRDLAMEGYEIHGKIYIHHLNPISKDDIIERSEYLMNPEFLVCTSFETHNAIHYGNADNLRSVPIERRANDTCLWKH